MYMERRRELSHSLFRAPLQAIFLILLLIEFENYEFCDRFCKTTYSKFRKTSKIPPSREQTFTLKIIYVKLWSLRFLKKKTSVNYS